jgi:hypothetical protein
MLVKTDSRHHVSFWTNHVEPKTIVTTAAAQWCSGLHLFIYHYSQDPSRNELCDLRSLYAPAIVIRSSDHIVTGQVA